jgi:hypothetical protein
VSFDPLGHLTVYVCRLDAGIDVVKDGSRASPNRISHSFGEAVDARSERSRQRDYKCER